MHFGTPPVTVARCKFRGLWKLSALWGTGTASRFVFASQWWKHPEIRCDGPGGIPVSPGHVTAPARVIHDPHAAQLAHGEILVAPSTDPGWTPLFLTAGGLVMETGGAMSHGAIVAREYGIPAVVGVSGAIERIQTGQSVTVDGTAGTVALADWHDPIDQPQT